MLQSRFQLVKPSKGFERHDRLVLHERLRFTRANEEILMAAVLVIAEHLVDCLLSDLLSEA